MEEASIFDKEFEDSLKYRRRSLLHRWLKIYLYMGILLGVIALAGLVMAYNEERNDSSVVAGYVILFLFVFFYILKYVLIMLEVRTAIRWNWVVGGLTTCIITAILVGQDASPYVLVELVSIPYWIMLRKIQYRWEKVAIAS